MKKQLFVISIAIVVLVIVVLITGWVVNFFVNDTIQRAVDPLLQFRGDVNTMSTEVAQIMHPTPTIQPDPVTIIHEVRALARLETIQYSVEKVITGDSGQNFFAPLFGDRMLFVAHGTVIAGVDLNKLTPGDLWVDKGILQVHLPDSEIFSASLDNEKSYVFNRQTGALTHGSADLETQVRRAAEQEIYKAAISDGILLQARLNGENYLTRLFHDLNFKDVNFIQPTPTPAGN